MLTATGVLPLVDIYGTLEPCCCLHIIFIRELLLTEPSTACSYVLLFCIYSHISVNLSVDFCLCVYTCS